MTQQITISIPKPLYQRVQALASAYNRPVDDVLDTAVALAEASLPSPEAAAAALGQVADALGQEEAAYHTIHAELMAHHASEYVAIYQGQLIDHDQDELALLHRLEAGYPDEVVLMKQVRPLPEPELRFRSPRLIRNGQ